MFKNCIFIISCFLSFTSCAQNKETLFSKQNKIAPKISIPLAADILVSNAANDFNAKLKKLLAKLYKLKGVIV